eukprot:tig00000142_g8644.t1
MASPANSSDGGDAVLLEPTLSALKRRASTGSPLDQLKFGGKRSSVVETVVGLDEHADQYAMLARSFLAKLEEQSVQLARSREDASCRLEASQDSALLAACEASVAAAAEEEKAAAVARANREALRLRHAIAKGRKEWEKQRGRLEREERTLAAAEEQRQKAEAGYLAAQRKWALQTSEKQSLEEELAAIQKAVADAQLRRRVIAQETEEAQRQLRECNTRYYQESQRMALEAKKATELRQAIVKARKERERMDALARLEQEAANGLVRERVETAARLEREMAAHVEAMERLTVLAAADAPPRPPASASPPATPTKPLAPATPERARLAPRWGGGGAVERGISHIYRGAPAPGAAPYAL